jgi:hypothetical protein
MPNVQKVCLVRLSVQSFIPFVWYARYKIVNCFSKWWHTQWLNAPTYRTFWMKPLLFYMHYCMWSDTLSHLPASLVSSMSLQNGIHSIHPLNFFPFSLLCKVYNNSLYLSIARYAWVLLILFQFLASNVSLLGHLSGILSGFACLSLVPFWPFYLLRFHELY